jgi:hypothetical protein
MQGSKGLKIRTMELLKKEAGVIELTLQGSRYDYDPSVQTDYSYELVIDPIINKPAFVLRSETRITFSPEDYIVYKSYAIYVFDHSEGDTINGDDLWNMAADGRLSMEILLQSRLNTLPAVKQVALPELDYQREISTLDRLVLAGFRLN